MLAAMIGAATASGQDAFDRTIDIIVNSNSQVQSERELAKAVALENTDANSLANPEVGVAYLWGAKNVGNKLQIDVTQSFDWPGLYGARRKANANQQIAADLLCEWTQLEVALNAKQLLIELVYVKKQMAMMNNLLLDVRQLEQAITAAQKQGYSSELDRRKIAIEAYSLSSQAASLEGSRAKIEGQLHAMCHNASIDLSIIDTYPIEQILTFEEYSEKIKYSDPQFLAYQMTVVAGFSDVKAAKMQRFPGFSVGYQHQTELGDHFNGFSVGVTLPFFENRQAHSAAQARVDAAKSQQFALLDQKQASLISTMAEMQAWRERVDNYNTVFGDNAYLTLIKKAYDGGELSLIEYINEVRYYAETTQVFLEAEYNFRSALAELNKYNLIKKQ